jgi:hypothetical protein
MFRRLPAAPDECLTRHGGKNMSSREIYAAARRAGPRIGGSQAH